MYMQIYYQRDDIVKIVLETGAKIANTVLETGAEIVNTINKPVYTVPAVALIALSLLKDK